MAEFKTPERIRKTNAAWRARNKERMEDYTKTWAQNNPEARMLISARARAKKKSLPFDITKEDIHIPTHCPVLGVELTSHFRKQGNRPGGQWNSPSLDRVVPELGYVRGNVVVMSHLANTLKGSATPEQLLKFADWIMRTYK